METIRQHLYDVHEFDELDQVKNKKDKDKLKRMQTSIRTNKTLIGVCLAIKSALYRLSTIEDKKIRCVVFVEKLFTLLDMGVSALMSACPVNAPKILSTINFMSSELSFALDYIQGQGNIRGDVTTMILKEEDDMYKQLVNLNNIEAEIKDELKETDHINEPLIGGLLLANIKALQRIKRIKDPKLRIMAIMERVISIGEFILANLSIVCQEKDIIPDIMVHVVSITRLIEDEADRVLEYVSTVISPIEVGIKEPLNGSIASLPPASDSRVGRQPCPDDPI